MMLEGGNPVPTTSRSLGTPIQPPVPNAPHSAPTSASRLPNSPWRPRSRKPHRNLSQASTRAS
ncbi:hypothetical protein BC834DRAFT_902252 [Gloeopeniophorella convolvens]|nr:hypothetical protein BC834DRAFT_902252 [Gloeopeniophorella convolvens]